MPCLVYYIRIATEMTSYNPPLPVTSVSVGTSSSIRNTKQLLYLYILLLIFEGALRKWVLPGLSGPLVVVRDPVAIAIVLYYAITHKYLFNAYTIVLTVVTTIAFCTTLAVGHGNIAVALFGFRTILLHFLVAFVMGQVFDRTDVEKIGRLFLYLAIPATILTSLQYFSPQSAWVNRGIGGDLEGSGFSGANGYMRPAGYFSFTNGNTAFYGLVAAFTAYFATVAGRCPGWLKIVGLIVVIIEIPISLSRGYTFSVALTGFAFLMASLYSSRARSSVLLMALFSPLLLIGLSQLEFFQTAIEVLQTRFTTASASEGSVDSAIVSRIFGPMIDALTGAGTESLPFFGLGLGLGTNVGAVLASGERTFLIAEFEWARVIGEMGFLLGVVVLLVRLVLSVHISILSIRALVTGNTLPLLILSTSLTIILLGQWSQPTALGFFAVSLGLVLASLRAPTT